VTSAPQQSEIVVTVEQSLQEATARAFYDLYVQSFGDMVTKAAARHLLHEEEFMEEMQDPRIDKYLLSVDAGAPVAMCTLTRHLEAVPWISPQYYRHHYPEFAADNRIFYLGYVLVAPEHRRGRVFLELGKQLTQAIVDARGMCAYDICRHNNDQLGIADAIVHLAGEVADFAISEIDTQTYYAAVPQGAGFVPEMRRKSD